MITKFSGMNISSKNPKQLVLFYKDKLGLTIIDDSPNFDGITFGNKQGEPVFWIWDENKWGPSTGGAVTLVFNCDDLDKTYQELKERGVELDPPKTTAWGGKELCLKDPEGNNILIL